MQNTIDIGAMNRLACGITFVVLLSGCAHTVQQASLPSSNRFPISEITDKRLAQDYAAERSYRPNPDEPLMLGLALSGGGTKAAMFAHGVLAGLNDAGILQRVDVISTVSGGGYAGYWYFTKLLAAEDPKFNVASIFADCIPTYWTRFGVNHPKLETAMLRAVDPLLPKQTVPVMQACEELDLDHYVGTEDPYRWQAHLVRWPDVFGDVPVKPDGSAQGRPDSELRQGVFKALVVEPFTQVFKHQSAVPSLYQWGIERTWGLNPAPRRLDKSTKRQAEADKWEYTNAARNSDGDYLRPLRVDPKTVTWNALRQLYEQKPAKEPIPLWIVNANAGGKTDPKENATRIFEMTAFGSGAVKFGYVNNIDKPPISDLGSSVRAGAGFADAQGLTSAARHTVELLSLIWPGARWGVPVDVVTQAGTMERIRLSDGGGGDNLGLISLLRRGVKHIIVVDAAQDVTGSMEDICAVREALAGDVEITFESLDELDDVCHGRKVYNVSDWKSPVVKGFARWTRGEAAGRVSTLWLIKAAWNQKRVGKTYTDGKCGNIGESDCLLTVYYGHNTITRIHGENDPDGFMVFPQLPTAGSTLNASSYLIWGYRELARSSARQLVWDAVNKDLSTVSEQCRQSSAAPRSGRRPYPIDDPRVTEGCRK